MILKKPYAVLIKYFKLIHIVMFIMFGYLVFALRKIYMFFLGYLKNENFVYVENMVRNYITPLMIIFVIIIFVSAVFIYFLMHKKQKPSLYYWILILYSTGLLFYFIYLISFYNSLELITYEPLDIVILRDVSLAFYIMNFFYVGFSFVRGFGFDIKKFNFDFDKRELNIEEGDNEEYELNVNIDRDRVTEYFNRQKREFKYYLQENKTFLIIVALVILLGVGAYIYLNFFVINKTYAEQEIISINEIEYQVDKSYLTTSDKNNNSITTNKEFILVKVKINTHNFSGTLNRETFRLLFDGKYYYPEENYTNEFNDLGIVYNGNNYLGKNTNNTYVLVFHVTKNNSKKAYLEILKNSKKYTFTKVKLNMQSIEYQEHNFHLNEEITINDKVISFTSFDIVSKTSYKYEDCYMEKCNIYTKNIMPKIGENVLILTVSNNEFEDKFYEDYFGISTSYRSYSASNISFLGKNDNSLYFSIPSTINKDDISLVITMRESAYTVLLGGEYE